MRVREIKAEGLESGDVIEIMRKGESSGRRYYYVKSEKRDGKIVMLVANERIGVDDYRGVSAIEVKRIKRIKFYPLDFIIWEK